MVWFWTNVLRSLMAVPCRICKASVRVLGPVQIFLLNTRHPTLVNLSLRTFGGWIDKEPGYVLTQARLRVDQGGLDNAVAAVAVTVR